MSVVVVGNGWKIWKAIEDLKASAGDDDKPHQDYDVGLLKNVIEILQLWAEKWAAGNDEKQNDERWKSFLNKRSFLHEVEESLIALHHINEWRQATGENNTNQQHSFVAADICGGKGVFSMLLQYYASLHWKTNDDDDSKTQMMRLDRIILLEKATSDDIDWHHLRTEECAVPGLALVPVEIWEDCNLHDTDAMVDRFQSMYQQHQLPIALTAIHLCKMLSPAFCSLVNLLGPHKCAYVCLVPCCMPRAVTRTARHKQNKRKNKQGQGVVTKSSFVRVYSYESESERTARLNLKQRRRAARCRTRGDNAKALECFCCKSTEHQLKFCPQIKQEDDSSSTSNSNTEQIIMARYQKEVTEALEMAPCWQCGMRGHFKANCPNPSIRSGLTTNATTTAEEGSKDPQQQSAASLLEPPVTLVDVTHVLESADPMRTYCELLMNSLDDDTSNPQQQRKNDDEDVHQAKAWTRTIWETDLVNTKAGKPDKGDWNGGRKSLYIVAYVNTD